MKKISTVSALVLGSSLVGAVLLAPTAQAADLSTDRTLSAAALPQVGSQTAYVQREETVTVYRNGKVQARVTAESAAHPRGQGKLVLTVEAKKAISFKAGQFIWEDEGGGDNEASNPKRKISVPAGTTKKVTIKYDGVEDGHVIWAKGSDTVVGAWTVEGRQVEGQSKLLPASYVQRGSTVTVYKGGVVTAKVTPSSASYADGQGVLKVKVEAKKKTTINPSSFVWEGPGGADNEAVPGQKKVTVKAKSTRTITVKFEDVADGAVFWAPRADVVAGAWTID
ncbi:hypothetical protein [Kineosporia babensis]|uniref:Uncharacterized protein n=1 Tax=Kineosporia babensis TaxID=499548 RepID=A0A9X1NFQ4_9ACTN|nr:hypothetical protein [Kineosporia babensis]MCD5312471.1 hypothetical protein [Kineosporia babensis]